MITANHGPGKSNSLLNEYSSFISDAMLRQRAHSAERSARIEAELANRVKQEFIANMSHELRTPLNTVLGFARLLSEQERRQLSDTQIVEYSNLIVDAASHLLSVINDILDISKIQSGRYALEKRETNLEELIEGCITFFEPAARQAGLTLQAHVDPALPVVRGDPMKLRQVLGNILGNAIKFTLPGGTVAITAQVADNDHAMISVADTGIGMTEEEINLALQPFGQVDAGRARWREGAGLGLPIARALVALHGGRLEIRSEKGVGTVATVYLPIPRDLSAGARVGGGQE